MQELEGTFDEELK